MFNKISFSALVSSLLVCTSCSVYKPTVIQSASIFENAQAPFEQCHASSMQQIGQDSLLATWFAGTHESNPDVSIYTALYHRGQWSELKKVADGQTANGLFPTWNPVLYQHPQSDTLYLYYKVGPNPREWMGYYKYSVDKGNSWSTAFSLPEAVLGPIKNKPYTLANGTILSPSSTESKEEVWKAHMEISKDKGKTWKIVPIQQQNATQVIQPSIIEHKNGDIQVLCRSKENVVMTSFSSDQGNTWKHWKATNLKNPNAAVDAIRLQNGLFMIVYNPDIAGKEWWEGRTKLYVALSKDGMNWEEALPLENGKEGDEYSYPCIIQDDKGLIHITYTWNRKNIKHSILK